MQQYPILILILYFFLIQLTSGYFRGGTVTWKVTSNSMLGNSTTNDGLMIVVTQRYIWQQSTTFSCNQTDIQKRKTLGFTSISTPIEFWNIYNYLIWDQMDVFVHLSGIVCIDFNEQSDYFISQKSTNIYMNSTLNFIATFTALLPNLKVWIELLNGTNAYTQPSWSLTTRIHSYLRANGRYNSAPTSEMNPVVKVPRGQSITINIPMNDIDGDITYCRWAQNVIECPNSYCEPVGQLRSNPCELTYTADNREGYVAVTIIIEDFNENNVSMSYISLQFLIEIFNPTLSSACNIIPFYLGDIIQGDCISVHLNEQRRERVILQVACDNINIVQISTDTQIPNLSIGTAVRDPTNSRIFIAYIDWTALNIQTYNFCLTALDSLSQSSVPACWTYQVIDETDPPFEFIDNSKTPSNGEQISNLHHIWQIKMLKTIVQPIQTSYIRFYRLDTGIQIEKIDVSSPFGSVKYNGTQLSFNSFSKWEPNTTYQIVFDSGVAIYNDTCQRSSPFQPKLGFWLFSTYPSCSVVCPDIECNVSLCQCLSESSTIVHCERIPVVYSISPSRIYATTNQTRITFLGDNLDLYGESAVWECFIGIRIIPGTYINKKNIQCTYTGIVSAGQVIDIILLMNKQYIGSYILEVTGICPTEGCIHGTCILGVCRCESLYRGVNCSSVTRLLALRTIENQTVIENSPFELYVNDLLQEGDEPLIWSINSPQADFQLRLNNQSSGLSFYWANTIARFNPYQITITAKQIETNIEDQRTFYLMVSFAYTVNVSFAQNISRTNFTQANPLLTIHGNIFPLDSHYQVSFGRTKVLVWVELNGSYRKYLDNVYVKENGQFQTNIYLLDGTYGTFTLGASHPLFRDQDTFQDYVNLIGFQTEILTVMPLQLRANTVVKFSSVALIRNPTNVPLNIIQIILIEPTTIDIDFNMTIVGCSRLPSVSNINELPHNSNCTIDLMIRANSSYQGLLAFRLLSNIDVSQELNLSIIVKPDGPEYLVETNSFQIIAIRGGPIQYFSTIIYNIGSQESSSLDVQLPNQSYIHAVTPSVKNIDVDGNATIIFGVRVPLGSPLQSYNIVCIIIDVQAKISIRFSIQLSIVGDNSTQVRVIFIIEDEFTYFADNHPSVSNVTLTLFNAQLNKHLQLFSGSNGSNGMEAIVTPAAYELNVQALKHKPLSALIIIDVTHDNTEWRIFLQRELVSYTWTVKPTDIDQEYTFTLEAHFETRVPAPVITIEPNILLLDDMEIGLIDHVDLTITNHGLIRADGVEIFLPTTHPFLKFRIIQEPIGSIPANTSVIVTMIIERSREKRSLSSDDQVDVCLSTHTVYWYVCGTRQGMSIPVPVFKSSGLSPLAIPNCISSGSPYIQGPGDGGMINSYVVGPTSVGFYKFRGGGGGDGNSRNPDSTIYRPQISTQGFCASVKPICKEGKPVLDEVLSCIVGILGSRPSSKSMTSSLISTRSIHSRSRRGIIPSEIDNLISLLFPAFGCVYNTIKIPLQIFDDVYKKGTLFTEDLAWSIADAVLRCLGIKWLEMAFNLGKCAYKIPSACNAKSLRVFRRSVSSLTAAEDDVLFIIGAINNYVEVAHLVFNDTTWFSVDNPSWFEAFEHARSNTSELGIYLSDYELRSLVEGAPNNVSTTMNMLLHYNRSLIEWTGPITNRTDNGSLSEREQIIKRVHQLSMDLEAIKVKGYDNFATALQAAIADYLQAKSDAVNQRGVCAIVKIRIVQKVTITGSAFEARLDLDNSGSSPLEQIRLDIFITDDVNRTNSTHLFSIGKPSFDGSLSNDTEGNGTLLASQSGSISLLIIPYATAAPEKLTVYRVGGRLSYFVDGEHLNINLVPDIIQVEPSPQLHIAYFLEKFVIGPDPLSSDPVVQEPEEFTLAMIITNIGAGRTRDFRIASSQPEIVENEKGLLIDFKLVSMYVDHQTTPNPSLKATIGDIKPNSTVNIRWAMLASLIGQFLTFNATFTEKNPNGDPKLSVVASLTTNLLIRLVTLDILDSTLSDNLTDFLIMKRQNAKSIPDTVVSSTNARLMFSVYHILNVTETMIDNFTLILIVTPEAFVPSTAYIYIRIDNLWTTRIIQSARRFDQSIRENLWTTHRVVHLKQGDRNDDFLHIFDRWNGQNPIEYEIKFDINTTTLPTTFTTVTETDIDSTSGNTTENPVTNTTITNTDSSYIPYENSTTEYSSTEITTLNVSNYSLTTISTTYYSTISNETSTDISTDILTSTTSFQSSSLNTTSSSSFTYANTTDISTKVSTGSTVTTTKSTFLSSSIKQTSSTTTLYPSLIKIFGNFFIQFSLKLNCDDSFQVFDVDIITNILLKDFIRAFHGWKCIRLLKIKLTNLQKKTIKTKRATNDRYQIEGIVQLIQTDQDAPKSNVLLTNLRQQLVQTDSLLKHGTLTSRMTRYSITNVKRMYRCSTDDNIDSFSDTCSSTTNSIKNLHLGLIIGFSILGLIILVFILCAYLFCCIKLLT